MNFEMMGVHITIRYPFLAMLAGFLALDKTGLGGTMLCAALLHELGHLFAMYAMRQPPHCIDFVSFGIRIVKTRSAIAYWREAIIFFSGPLANLLVVFWDIWNGSLSQLGQIHLVMGLFNLLPIGALDGSMLVSCVAHAAVGPRFAQILKKVLSVLFFIPLAVLSIWSVMNGQGNITLIVTLLYLAATVFFSKSD